MTQALQVRLQVRALGQAEVLIDGQPAQWHAQGARELFFYLLSHPEGSGRDEMIETLWGLEPGPASHNRFRVTLHRLRTALGTPEAVAEAHGRYHLSPEVFAASDMHTMYAALDEAEKAQDSRLRLAAYQRAIGAYGGEYLPGERAEWVDQAREEHKAAYVRAAVELSLAHCDQGSCAAAVGALVGALRADPFIGENYHQKLMACLSVVEGRYAAIEHYRRFVRFLRDELEDTPMDETRDLAERIKVGEPICQRLSESDGPPTLTHSCPLTPDGRCPGPLKELIELN